MPILRQIFEALAVEIENFFSVPWRSVVCMLLVVLGLAYVAYSRTVYSLLHPPDLALRTLSWLAVWGGLWGARYFLRR